MLWLDNKKNRSLIFQFLLISLVLALGYVAIKNIDSNLAGAGIYIDYGFLNSEAGFDVNESLIDYDTSQSYSRVLLVGFLNTLTLAVACIIGATCIGVIMGMLRASSNWLGSRVALIYIELMRNLPKLLILLAIYIGTVNSLPTVRQAWSFFDAFFVSKRAFYFPTLQWQSDMLFVLEALFIGFVGLFLYSGYAHRYQDDTGRRLPVLLPALVVLAVLLTVSSSLFGVHYEFVIPVLKGFDFIGGGRVSVQFLVLALTLSIYHGGQVAELVRGGIEAVPAGQAEAAQASGLSYFQVMRLVVLPQALRVIIPPMGNQYLNITKNTSIGLAVGYSDLVSVMNTSINQTFRPIEMMSVTMLIYLAICLFVTLLINWYNARTGLEQK